MRAKSLTDIAEKIMVEDREILESLAKERAISEQMTAISKVASRRKEALRKLADN